MFLLHLVIFVVLLLWSFDNPAQAILVALFLVFEYVDMFYVDFLKTKNKAEKEKSE